MNDKEMDVAIDNKIEVIYEDNKRGIPILRERAGEYSIKNSNTNKQDLVHWEHITDFAPPLKWWQRNKDTLITGIIITVVGGIVLWIVLNANIAIKFLNDLLRIN